MVNFDTLEALDVQGRRILVRSDLNVPMQDGRINDDTRIRLAAQTIRDLADRGACDCSFPFWSSQGEIVL